MHVFGLIGYPLSHSFSKRYFTEKFEREGLAGTHRYELFPLQSIEELTELLAGEPDLRGLNVTIPYKEQVLPYLDELAEGARDIGAVNTIKIADGRLTGYNTDVAGFRESLEEFLRETGGPPRAALILGTGGAAKAVAYVLRQMGIAFQYVSRQAAEGQLAYGAVDNKVLAAHDLIINTTPLGMSPKVDDCPAIDYSALEPHHRLYDLVYNPAETLFMQRGKAQGAATRNGISMLYGQAEHAWQIWQR